MREADERGVAGDPDLTALARTRWFWGRTGALTPGAFHRISAMDYE